MKIVSTKLVMLAILLATAACENISPPPPPPPPGPGIDYHDATDNKFSIVLAQNVKSTTKTLIAPTAASKAGEIQAISHQVDSGMVAVQLAQTGNTASDLAAYAQEIWLDPTTEDYATYFDNTSGAISLKSGFSIFWDAYRADDQHRTSIAASSDENVSIDGKVFIAASNAGVISGQKVTFGYGVFGDDLTSPQKIVVSARILQTSATSSAILKSWNFEYTPYINTALTPGSTEQLKVAYKVSVTAGAPNVAPTVSRSATVQLSDINNPLTLPTVIAADSKHVFLADFEFTSSLADKGSFKVEKVSLTGAASAATLAETNVALGADFSAVKVAASGTGSAGEKKYTHANQYEGIAFTVNGTKAAGQATFALKIYDDYGQSRDLNFITIIRTTAP